jgi:hypothetical protein
LIDMVDDQVHLRWKDYRAASQPKTMTLGATEFLRRLLLHVLPTGFQRIRYYGLLGNRHRTEKLAVSATPGHGATSGLGGDLDVRGTIAIASKRSRASRSASARCVTTGRWSRS